MTRKPFFALLAIFTLTACAEEGKYPVSGEDCRADDAVQTLDASDCAALPAGGSGTF